jgi:phage repressor protein C with HTH and peptisase S24 domain
MAPAMQWHGTGDRIEWARLRYSPAISQAELARRVGMKQSTLNGLIKGSSRSTTFLPQLARELGTTAAFLQGETDDPSIDALPAPSPASIAEQLDSVLVPFYDAPHDMGDGAYFDFTVTPELMPFSRKWLRGKGVSSFDRLALLPGRGRSMEPTIHDGDVLLVDKGQIEVREANQIWAFAYGETGMIKRLMPKPDGNFLVTSDNATVAPPFEASRIDIHIEGRIAAILKWE